jgi:hypothetical protein
MYKLSPLNHSFVSQLAIGEKLYYFQSDPAASNEMDYILFTVIDIKEDKVVLQMAFDEQERKKYISKSELLINKHWRYNPSFEHRDKV